MTIRVEDSPKRIRAYVGGRLVVDTIRARLAWEDRPYPAYWLPRDDVRVDLLGEGAGARDSQDAGLRDYVHVPWRAVEHWFEEDEEVFVHPRDPHTRVDILPSSRHVEVVINGVTVANSHQPRLLFETGLPTRYYLPLVDVRLDLLHPSDTTTRCPYKGTAGYWSVEAGGQVVPDLAWIYRAPVAESVRIAGLACFYNEKVELYVDGERQEQPHTKFS